MRSCFFFELNKELNRKARELEEQLTNLKLSTLKERSNQSIAINSKVSLSLNRIIGYVSLVVKL